MAIANTSRDFLSAPMSGKTALKIPLPKGWSNSVKSAILRTISLAHYTIVYARGWAVNSPIRCVRLKADNERLDAELALLREEMRIKDARMAQIAPHRRPFYPPTERLAILELKTARGWSLEQTARTFLVTAATVASWTQRLDEDGPNALVQVRQPVNKFPDFVRYVVQRLKTLCPALGKQKIAQVLARAGLHLGTTSIGRMLMQKPNLHPPRENAHAGKAARIVKAKCPNHLWHVDLTLVPTLAGMCCSWMPFAWPQRWPFAWWLGLAVDHFSRRATGFAAFTSQPTSKQVQAFLGRAIRDAGNAPRHIVCDRGPQFDCDGFRRWCRRKGIRRPRYGAVGQHGSIAVIERLILSIKTILGCLPLVPLRAEVFRREVVAVLGWYNEHRPHTTLDGKTPGEVYFARFPSNRKPRFEPRSRWPRGSSCAAPWALARASPGAPVELDVVFQGGRRHLPIVRLRRVA